MNLDAPSQFRNTSKAARIILMGVLATALLAGNPVPLFAEPAAASAKVEDLSKQITGTWVYLGKPGETVEPPAEGGRFKTMQHGLYRVTQKDEKGAAIYHHGGTYTLQGNEYAEKCEYSSDPKSDLIKQTFRFTIKVEGDLLTQTGVGNPWTEVWRRVK